MVVLSRICTKTGDRGTTCLGNGARVSKADARIVACGSVDELNSFLGLVIAHCSRRPFKRLLQEIQNDLFDVGADLCVPPSPKSASKRTRLRLDSFYAQRLEAKIDLYNARLKPLESFVLPGGAPAASWLHVARAVSRRAERDAVALSDREPVNPHVIIYLNRLSDLLFVMARVANQNGRRDVLWRPGKSRG
ncbi:MAG: cob(I)yrinic acid a,c-diamide adenosyltransferase [Candidatus Omnitrophica bacterium]|nr:cob(I)yrinic acid a,c-diamide adenosyltransferase [Candidatus Omnitrophota bacterium]